MLNEQVSEVKPTGNLKFSQPHGFFLSVNRGGGGVAELIEVLLNKCVGKEEYVRVVVFSVFRCVCFFLSLGCSSGKKVEPSVRWSGPKQGV